MGRQRIDHNQLLYSTLHTTVTTVWSPVPVYGGMLPVGQRPVARVAEPLALLAEAAPGEGRAVPLVPGVPRSRAVPRHRAPQLGGHQEPPGH